MGQKAPYEELECKVKELKKANDELSHVISMSLDLICIADINTSTFIKVNPAFTDVLGYSEEELLNKPFGDFIHPDDIEKTQKVVQERLRAGAKVLNFQNRYRCKDGSYRWLSWVSHPVPEKGVTFAIARDITEWKENQEAFEKSKSLLDATGRMAKVGGWEIDPRTQEVTWTKETYRIHEVPIGDKPSLKSAIEFFHPDDRPQLERAIERAIEGEAYDLELRFITAKGKKLWTRSKCQPEIVDGKILKLKGTFQDITDRKLAQEAVEKSEERLRTVINNSPFPVAFVDTKDEKVIFWSQSARDKFGHTPEVVADWYAVAYPDPAYRADVIQRWKPFVKLAQETNMAVNAGEYKIVCKDGSIKECEIYAQFIPGNLVVTLNDITSRKRMEEQILQTQKMEAIGTLAGGIAHDFNNMLTAIMGNISYALSLITKESPLHEVLTDVENSSKQARGLTQQLLTFSKGGNPIKQVCDINAILKNSSALSIRGAKSKCEFALSSNLWPAEVDDSQLSQVFNNLIINANQAMPNGGSIRVSTENVTVGSELNRTLPTGQYIMVSIEDSGIGIPQEHLPNIFEPYFSTKQTGSGLGLATVYSIIKRHGGHIFVYSEIEKGTAFRIYLPASKEKLSKPQAQPVPMHKGTGKILVMDDQDIVLRMIKRMLSSMGYEVTFASDGRQAIKLYEEALSSESPFKAVILDLTIPGGMGGASAINELLEIDPNVRAVVSSGYSNDPILSNHEDFGFSGILTKPYVKAKLSDVLNKIFSDESK